MFCSQCGSKIVENAVFCSACGSKHNQYSSGENEAQASSTDDLYLEAYFKGTKDNVACYNYYKLRAKKMIHNDQINFEMSWNWGGFFFGIFHLIYRKSYLFALVFWLVSSATSGFFGLQWLASGIANNYLVLKNFLSKKKEAMLLYPNSIEEQLNFLRRRGGVNLGLPVFIFFIAVILMAIFFYFYLSFIITAASGVEYFEFFSLQSIRS